jgi:predicted amidohydrolase
MTIRKSLLSFLVFATCYSVVSAEQAGVKRVPQLDRAKLPGKQVKVAAICIGFGGERKAKLKEAINQLHTAGRNGVDIACLPEEFAGTNAESIPGLTTNAVSELAKLYNMYIVCPIREQAGDKQYNTAVLIDRKGKITGY